MCIIFTIIFETLSRGEIGKKNFGFLKFLERFLHEDFFKVNLYLLESEIVPSSLIDLPDILAISLVLFTWNAFKILERAFKRTFWNLNLF